MAILNVPAAIALEPRERLEFALVGEDLYVCKLQNIYRTTRTLDKEVNLALEKEHYDISEVTLKRTQDSHLEIYSPSSFNLLLREQTGERTWSKCRV